MWMVRAGRGGDAVNAFLDEGIVGFNDGKIGAISAGVTKEALLERYREHFPTEKEGSRASWAAQLFRFRNDFKIGDPVVTYDPEVRRYYLGKITGDYRFDGEKPGRPSHVRPVTWTHEADRDALALATKNTLGSTLTVFRLNPEAASDLVSAGRPRGEPTVAPPVQPKSDTGDSSSSPTTRSAERTSSSRTQSTLSIGPRCKSSSPDYFEQWATEPPSHHRAPIAAWTSSPPRMASA